MADEKPKFERAKRGGEEVLSEAKAAAPFDVAAKAEAIMKSDMPEAQKQAYLRDIGFVKAETSSANIPFNVYASLKRIPAWKHQAMKLYPKAVGVESIPLEQWDEIFQDF